MEGHNALRGGGEAAERSEARNTAVLEQLIATLLMLWLAK
jgi:hypothetical protein